MLEHPFSFGSPYRRSPASVAPVTAKSLRRGHYRRLVEDYQIGRRYQPLPDPWDEALSGPGDSRRFLSVAWSGAEPESTGGQADDDC